MQEIPNFRNGYAPPNENGGVYNDRTIISTINEVLSDVFGALLPGIYFTFVLVVLMFLAMKSISELQDSTCDFEYYVSLLTDHETLIVISFIVFSFIMGSIFYRKDIKDPDERSVDYLWEHGDRSCLAVRAPKTEYEKIIYRQLMEQKEQDWSERKGKRRISLLFPDEYLRKKPIKNKNELLVDFPYLYIKEYLENRKLSHLSRHLSWDGLDEKKSHRTKMFINILKLRIEFYAPDSMGVITKNEAHIRLMSSLWYATKYIFKLSAVILICSMGLFFVMKDAQNLLIHTTFLLSFALLQIILSLAIQRAIIKFFHYQRVREIVYVLELADIVSKNHPEIFEFLGGSADPMQVSKISNKRALATLRLSMFNQWRKRRFT